MKKILLVFGVIFGLLLVPFQSVFAEEFVSQDVYDKVQEIINGNKDYVYFPKSDGNLYILETPKSNKKFKTSTNTIRTKDSVSFKLHKFTSEGVFVSTVSDYGISYSATFSGSIIASSSDIYTNDSYSSVFFSPRVLPPVELKPLETVREIPVVMMGTLVDGGLISLGLTILAILLGVSLVVRLKRLFLR